MNKALYEVVFHIKEKNPETLLPELYELLGTATINDFPTLSVLVEHSLYFYQFTNLPNPLEDPDLNKQYNYAYKLTDFQDEPEKLKFCRDLLNYFSLREFNDQNFNYAMACLKFVGKKVTEMLGW